MNDRYKYFQHGNEVIAVSTFAGKKVRGVAKCDPKDEFNLEDGKELAAARCNQKIAAKRLKRASQKYLEAANALEEAMTYFEHMKVYYMDAVDAYDKSAENLINITERL